MTAERSSLGRQAVAVCGRAVPAACWSGARSTATSRADPLAEITNETGIWTLRFVAITLAITPLRRSRGWNAIIRFRRMLGLFAFFYGTLHFLTYVIADRFASLDFPDGFVALSTCVNLVASVWEDVASGRTSPSASPRSCSMIPLALTSTTGWIRRLGGRNWQRLHRLIYLTGDRRRDALLVAVKADTLHPAIYAAIVAVLLGFRLVLSHQAIEMAALRRGDRNSKRSDRMMAF